MYEMRTVIFFQFFGAIKHTIISDLLKLADRREYFRGVLFYNF